MAAETAFDHVIDTAAAGDFAALGWHTGPLDVDAPAEDDGFEPVSIDTFLRFST